MNKQKPTLPAEWSPVEAVLLSWPHVETDWDYMLPEVTSCFREIARAIIFRARLIVVAPDISVPKTHLAPLPQDRITYIECPTNDTWARDFGPITTIMPDGTPVSNDFRFNGWGLKFAANYDNLITRRLAESGILAGKYTNRLGFVLEGGSIESDGQGLLMTTSECLLSLNRNGEMSADAIDSYLREVFGVERVLWVDHGFLAGDDTDSHIDTLARLAPDNTIIYTGCTDPDDIHYEALQAMAAQLRGMVNRDGKPFNLVELPLPDAVYDRDDGSRLPATYANFLFLNGAVLLPVYGQPLKDNHAIRVLEAALPDYEIVPVDCRALIRQHGSLHCVTMQFPKNSVNL